MQSLNKLKVYIKSNFRYWYHIRYSRFYLTYLRLKNRSLAIHEQKEYRFISQLIPKDQLVYDIGANTGEYTNLYLKLSSKVIAIEPDPKNLQILKVRFGQNRKVTTLASAVSDVKGVSELYINEDGSCFNTMSEKWKDSLLDPSSNRWHAKYDFSKSYQIQTITLNEVITQYGLPFFIKVDVEGYEYKVISTLTKKVALINFEANLPEFLEETILIVDHLNKIYTNYKFNFCEDYTFHFGEWKNYTEFKKFVTEANHRYLDIWVQAF